MQNDHRKAQNVRSWTEPRIPARTVSILAPLLIAASISFLPGEGLPQEGALELGDGVLDACAVEHGGQPELESCFGAAVDDCLERFSNEAIIPLICWQDELAVWKKLMAQTYMALLQDVQQRGYGTFASQIETAQAHWLTQSRLDCEIQAAATPRAHETTGTSCMAEAAHNRTLFLRELLGADWTEAP